ncbi:MAG: hypothetical protein WC612_06355 [Bdellovibrionales bacterium]
MTKPNKNIFFFTDISESIGTGHFWRSARLAQTLGQTHPEACVTMMMTDNVVSRRAVERFCTASPNSGIVFLFDNEAVPQKGTSQNAFELLPPDYIAKFPADRDLTIIDSYRICAEELRQLKTHGTVGVVDDFGHIPDLGGEHVDFVINANNFGASYSGASQPKVFASPNYHFLSPDLFVDHPHNPNSVVITFGGTDKGHLGLKLLDRMWREDPSTLNNFEIKVVVPCPENEQVYRASALMTAMQDRLEIVRQYNPADFFGRAGMIICAGGQTVPEAQAAGVRFVGIVSLNQTQTSVCRWAKRQGIEVANYEGLGGENLELEETHFAKACLNVLRLDGAVQLPQQNPNGFPHLVDDLWAYANDSILRPEATAKAPRHSTKRLDICATERGIMVAIIAAHKWLH